MQMGTVQYTVQYTVQITVQYADGWVYTKMGEEITIRACIYYNMWMYSV